jgi:hypothetical protein
VLFETYHFATSKHFAAAGAVLEASAARWLACLERDILFMVY